MRRMLLVPVLILGAELMSMAADVPEQHRLSLTLRRRVKQADGAFAVREEPAAWDARETALVICDMWDVHWCQGATRRVAEVAPHLNRFVAAARAKGVLIVHAPSGCMGPYEPHAARQRARSAPKAANLPKDIGNWSGNLPAESQVVYPIDQADGGCDDEPTCKQGGPWRRQIATIEMRDEDAISDSGVEVWNLYEQRGVKNVLLAGVHTNMCVLGRAFGLRNMVRCGKNTALVRDLTDTMYNSERPPHVSHFRGTDLIVEHIEKVVCPTVTSDQLLGGQPFRFNGSRLHLVIVAAEELYKTKETLPAYAKTVWEQEHGWAVTVLEPDAKDPNVIPGFADALAKADVLVLSVRRRALPQRDLDALRQYLDAGKPLVALRTSSHAFDTKGKHPEGHAEWPTFDPEVLGGNYQGHHAEGPRASLAPAPNAAKHYVLSGVTMPFGSNGSLYKTSPLAASATPLLLGSIPNQKPEPVAWVNAYKKARVFYTSLGHPDDFKDAAFTRLLSNAILWVTRGRPATEATKP